jgi:EAL domain-containing protein (putative c-di-GMP-specific phosphodiesterase class I)
MIKAIAQLAKVMCMETIAEYVETDSLRVKMTELGVDYGQGFAMGKSQPLVELLAELAIYEATVSTWDIPESVPAEIQSLGQAPASRAQSPS